MIFIIILLFIFLIIFILFYNKSKKEYLLDILPYNIVLAGCAKNIENYILNSLDICDRIGQKFNNYSVVIYENDSYDKTRELLLNNKKENYYYILEDNVNISQRPWVLANCRNKLFKKVKEIEKERYIKYDYLIMIDLDDVISSGKIVDTILTSFEYDVNTWDVMTANQTYYYYDIWAYRKKGSLEEDCWKLFNEDIKNGLDYEIAKYNNVRKYQTPIPVNGLIPVESSFGGVGIYKLSSIEDCIYSGIDKDNNVICEHVPFHLCLINKGKKIFINTKMLTN